MGKILDIKFDGDFLSNISYAIFLSLFVFLFSIFLLSSIGFIFNLKINLFYPVISLLLSYFTLYKFLNYKNFHLKTIIFVGIINTLVITLSLFISSHFTDYTFDGRSYHQHGVILMSDGWNPVWQKIEEFGTNVITATDEVNIWTQNYPKFCEIIAANFLKITSNIESAKAYQFIFFFMVFFYSFFVLNKSPFCKINTVFKGLFSFGCAINPVIISQVLSFYVDSAQACLLTILIFSIIDMETSNKEEFKIPLIIFALCSVSVCSIKLGGIFSFCVTALTYSIFLFLKHEKYKLNLIKKALGLIIFAFILTNLNPYFTNAALYKRNPVYPLNKINILANSVPFSIQNAPTSFHGLFISLFSRSDNELGNKKAVLKVPFTFSEKEYYSLGVDTRIGGFGVLFGGIFLLSFIMLFFIRYNSKEDKELALLIFSILAALSFLNPHGWWARYSSQIWLFPVFSLLFFISGKQKGMFSYVVVFLILICMFINSGIFFKRAVAKANEYKRSILFAINKIPKNKTVKVYCTFETSFLQKLKEQNVKYELVSEEYFRENKERLESIPSALYEDKDKWQFGQ